ncbi:hypothetical protein [Nocardia mangyaensis]|uniref:hypothetical protein n=1 Tax=Nocardia mangyaensis TaxID=2213200 RepID=UPI0026755AB9|nr:hypothetical protein [Nocardia mangyaensis]MDO3648843.1 hypothetical protein [Nocardia mangyaensis]
MAETGGFFNHYDDPDEFWPDEPLVRPAAATPETLSASRSAAPFNSSPADPAASWGTLSPRSSERMAENQGLQTGGQNYGAAQHDVNRTNRRRDSIIDTWKLSGSPFVSMQVDRGLLPIAINLDRSWDQRVQPHEYGTELFKAYELATIQELGQILSSQKSSADASLELDCGVPDRRAQLTALLETSRWSDYQEKLEAMIAKSVYEASGCILHSGEPVVIITADRMRINSMTIRPHWGEPVDPAALVDDLLFCADQIRRQRPKLAAWSNYSRYSISDIEYQHEIHVRTLIEQAYN